MSPAADAATPKAKDEPKWCLMCHPEPTYTKLKESAHNKLLCRDCHEGFQFNPHEAVEEPPDQDLSKVKPFAKTSASALASCSGCHDEVGSPTELLAHGKGEDPSKPNAYCLDCHGEPHQIPKTAQLADDARRLAQNAACTTCHGDTEKMGERGTEPAHTYADSIHLRKVALGSQRAPGCVDCHGGHDPKALTEAPEKVCAECHEGATAEFAKLVSHKPVSKEHRPVAFYTQKVFGWLTFLTILGLLGHVFMDITHSLGGRRGSRNGKK